MTRPSLTEMFESLEDTLESLPTRIREFKQRLDTLGRVMSTTSYTLINDSYYQSPYRSDTLRRNITSPRRCNIDGLVCAYDQCSKSELPSGNFSQADWRYLGVGTIVGSSTGELFNFWVKESRLSQHLTVFDDQTNYYDDDIFT